MLDISGPFTDSLPRTVKTKNRIPESPKKYIDSHVISAYPSTCTCVCMSAYVYTNLDSPDTLSVI